MANHAEGAYDYTPFTDPPPVHGETAHKHELDSTTKAHRDHPFEIPHGCKGCQPQKVGTKLEQKPFLPYV